VFRKSELVAREDRNTVRAQESLDSGGLLREHIIVQLPSSAGAALAGGCGGAAPVVAADSNPNTDAKRATRGATAAPCDKTESSKHGSG
jgi:hypothetical protein